MLRRTLRRLQQPPVNFNTEPQLTELALRIDRLERRISRAATAPSTQVSSQPSGVLDTEAFNELYEFSSRQPMRRYTGATLKNIHSEESLRQYATFLSREVKVRLAHMAAELAHAPFGFGQMAAIKKLRELHEQSYVEIRSVRIDSSASRADIEGFCERLHGVYRRHHVTTDLVARGLDEFVRRNHLDEGFRASHGMGGAWSETMSDSFTEYQDFQTYLEGIFMNRIKVRYLIGHFVEAARQVGAQTDAVDGDDAALVHGLDHEDQHAAPRHVGMGPDTFVGAVCTKTHMPTVAKMAISNAQLLMNSVSGYDAPEVSLEVHGDPELCFTYVPKQAFNVVTSLVAHSIKQELRLQKATPGRTAQPISVLISQAPDQQDVVVRIRDHANGIPAQDLDVCNTFLYNGQRTQALATMAGSDGDALKGWMRSSLRLPVAAVIARCFGGDLSIASVHGDFTTVSYCAPTAGFEHLSF